MRNWVAVMPGRLSFGLIGFFESVYLGVDEIHIYLQDLKFTPDVFDRSTLAMSGAPSLASLVEHIKCTPLYMLAITDDGKLRVVCADEGVEVTHSGVFPWAECTPVTADVLQLAQFQPVIQRLAIKVCKNIETWRTFLLGRDELWKQTEACLATNFKEWTQVTSILKMMLCPPTC